MSSKKLPYIAVVLIVGFLGAVLFLLFGRVSSEWPYFGEDPKFDGPQIPISAKDLEAAYSADEKAANARYTGRGVEVTGKIMTLGSDWANHRPLEIMMTEEFKVLIYCIVPQE